MDTYEEAMQNFIASIRETDVYAEYREALEELRKDPELKRRVDDFRKRNYNFQQSEDMDLAEYDRFRTEIVGFRSTEPRADAFFDAELAFCRMMQDMTYKITEALDFE
ncbi:MAG: YlbF family regulator [Lachnospiraceae bacterium]|nr:YlbF family regulator [Lachnospiraceae bacterium]